MALTPEDVVNKRFQPTKFREGYDQDEVDDFLDEIVVELRRLNQENDDLRKKLADCEAGTQANATAAAPVVETLPSEDAASTDTVADPEPATVSAAQTTAVAEDDSTAAQTGSSDAEAPATAASSAGTGNLPGVESAAGVLAMAQKLHDEYVTAGIEQRDKIISDAQVEANTLVTDAQEKSRKTLGALEQERSVLERKIEQLRGFERDYRARLKAYIEGQLRDLDAHASVATPEAAEES